MEFSKGKNVRLKSFLGTLESEENIERHENYWLLIGQNGKIIDDEIFNNDRILILFENMIDDYFLENHNPIKNSLWIKTTDLEIIV